MNQAAQRRRLHVGFQLVLLALIILLLPAMSSEGNVLLAIDASDQMTKEHLESIALKASKANRDLVEGIARVVVVTHDIDFLAQREGLCNGHLLGVLANDTLIVRNADEKTNTHTMNHEFGHNLWKRLDDGKKSEWEWLFDSNSTSVTPYGGQSAEEDFAESISCVLEKYDGCSQRLLGAKRNFIEKIL